MPGALLTMEIKTTHIIIALGVLAILSQGENVRSSVEKTESGANPTN
jgi:hypothetical protein